MTETGHVKIPETPTPETQPKPPRLGLWLLTVLVGMGMLQMLNARNTAQRPPGPVRGDIAFTQDALAPRIGHWEVTQFQVLSPEELPEGQFWWTHSWNYTNGAFNSTVTFDQADFAHWHDLTVCYRGLGWTLAAKSVLDSTPDTDPWPCVVARLNKTGTDSALLVFSLFFDDGDPVDPRDYETPETSGNGLWRQFESRFKSGRRKSTVGSVRQCQVLVPYSGTLDSETEASIIDLHLQTRDAFRKQWLAHWQSALPK